MRKLIYKLLHLMGVICVAVLLNSIDVYAAEKKMDVSLAKDYSEAIFTFEFTDGQSHRAEVITPAGAVYSEESEEKTIKVAISNASAGTYEVLLTAENEISVDSRVECLNTTTAEVGSSLTVTSQLSGLKIYFLDGNLCVEWDDTGIGKVNVIVTNPVNMQKLVNTSVSGTNFYLEIAESVQEVEVYVVPAAEAKIEGAGVTYTMPVIREVHGKVEIPEVKLTNSNYYDIEVVTEEELGIRVTNNGKTEVDVLKGAGEHTVNLYLSDIKNDIVVYLIDALGNMESYEFTVTKDLVAPTLNMSQDYDGKTSSSEIELIGYAKEASKVLINNVPVEMDSNGKFTYLQPLVYGYNKISVCAMDEAGNEAIMLVSVTREDVKNNSGIIFIIGMLLLFMLLVVVIVVRKKRMNPVQSDNEPTPEKSREQKKNKGASKKKRKEKKRKSNVAKRLFMKSALGSILVCAVSIGCIYVFVNHFVGITTCQSASMSPFIDSGEMVIFNKLAYLQKEIERGDVICFYSKEEDKYLIKRVIGIPGDMIEFHDGNMFINGMIADESAYLGKDIETNSGKAFSVPSEQLFVLGDNRNGSVDSRYFEAPYIDMGTVMGKYLGSF